MSEVVKNKLVNYEAQPSPKVWEAVQAALADDQPQLRERLENFEATAPARIWTSIEAALGSTAPVVPMRKKTNLFKYAIAAAAIVFAVVLVNVLIKNDKPGADIVTNTLPDAPQVPIDDTSSQTAGANPDRIRTPGDEPSTGIPSDPPTAAQKERNSRYMTVANDDGKKVRLSKKVYPVINCAEKTAAIAWSKCKETIQTLQEKMATSVNVASTDFGGLLDMLQDLEDNR